MKALLHTAPFRIEHVDYPDPEIAPDEVLVRVHAVGICGSDVHGYTGRSGRRIPPVVMGHEAAGTVEHVGRSAAGDWRPGDRVCFDSTVYCARCLACREGHVNRCQHRQVLGVSVPGMRRDGAMADYVRLPGWALVRMPDPLAFVEAALLEPVSIGLHAAARGNVGRGETVLVVGAGTIGLFIVQAARLHGAARIIASDPRPSRRALAARLGADTVIDPAVDDLSTCVAALTGGRGADVSFEAVGTAGTLAEAIAATATGGRVVLVGNLTPRAEIPVQDVVARELVLVGTYASSGEYRAAVDLVAGGRIDVRALVSEIRPLAEGPQLFERLYRGEEDLVKVVLTP